MQEVMSLGVNKIKIDFQLRHNFNIHDTLSVFDNSLESDVKSTPVLIMDNFYAIKLKPVTAG